MNYFCSQKPVFFRKAIALFVLAVFSFQLIIYPASSARAELVPNLPVPGTMVSLTDHFEPPILLGMTINLENPLLFEFLIDRGQDQAEEAELTNTSDRLVKYFLSAMTVPDAEAWVNLSPYEKDRIMPDHLSATEMGKTMLEQDYMLKQLSASLTNPDKELGKKFWDTVKKKAQERFGTTELPMSTLNKVWIVPQKALVLEKDAFVLIGESRLKVMLEEDVVASSEGAKQSTWMKQIASPLVGLPSANQIAGVRNDVSKLSSEVFRDMIVPELEKEVNEGTTFAPVRQIYHAVILAAWYKKNLRESLLGQVYIDKNKIAGVDIAEKNLREKVYDQYLSAFQKGVYNFIKDEVDLSSKEALPRKYFSGGTSFSEVSSSTVTEDLTRPSSAARAAIGTIKDKFERRRILSANVQLADSKGLEKTIRGKARASSSVRTPREYYFDYESNYKRGINVLEDAYKISTFLGPRNEKGPATILLVGAGWGVAALQMALQYPNFTIWAVNKEKGLWNMAKAIARVGQLEKDRYSDPQIVEALNRIQVIESLDIEDDAARGRMLATTPKIFDAVIVEMNVSLYLEDQIRVFEKLFNKHLKADGFFAFEVSLPNAAQPNGSVASEELALASIERAFVDVGDIVSQNRGAFFSYTIERNNPQQVVIPLEKDRRRSIRFDDEKGEAPTVFWSKYTVKSSSAVSEKDLHRSIVFYALLIMRVNSQKIFTRESVLDSIPKSERGSLTRDNIGDSLRSLLGEPDAQGQWVSNDKAWSDLLSAEVMRAMMALNYRTVENIFMVMPNRMVEQKTALLSLWKNLLVLASRPESQVVTDSQILAALKESNLSDFLVSPSALDFSVAMLNAHLTVLMSPAIDLAQVVPVNLKIKGRPRTVNVGKNIVGEEELPSSLSEELAKLIELLQKFNRSYVVNSVIDDPNTTDVLIYNETLHTAIIPRYVTLEEINDRLESGEMKVSIASSSALGKTEINSAVTSDAGIILKKGGIDFNPALFDLQIKRDGKGVPLPLPQQNLENINIEGFYPVIINIQPATLQSFSLLLSAKN